jgi:hypothetical protein
MTPRVLIAPSPEWFLFAPGTGASRAQRPLIGWLLALRWEAKGLSRALVQLVTRRSLAKSASRRDPVKGGGECQYAVSRALRTSGLILDKKEPRLPVLC